MDSFETSYYYDFQKQKIFCFGLLNIITNTIIFTSIGDSPARAFESGNQINGHYPCNCGADIRCATDCTALGKPKFLSLKDRQDVIDQTKRWDNRLPGVLSVYDNLNVSKK